MSLLRFPVSLHAVGCGWPLYGLGRRREGKGVPLRHVATLGQGGQLPLGRILCPPPKKKTKNFPLAFFSAH